jgi:hypothetical protein
MPFTKQALRPYPEPYPDYGRSLVSQMRSEPETSGQLGAAGGGLLGAALGAAGTRAVSDDPKAVVLGSLLAALLGGAVGHYGGKKDRESQNTRLLALRRAGIDNPAELELLQNNPMLAYRLTDKGSRV